MRICIYGCGAIGGLLAARLAVADSSNQVSVIARGPHLAAIRKDGLRLTEADGEIVAKVVATDNPADLGVQDVVFLTLKAHTVPTIAAQVAPLLGANTVVVTACNGIPWWYFHGIEKDFGAPELSSVDPGKALWRALQPERALGCVVYPAAAVTGPGQVRRIFGDRFALGEPTGANSPRLTEVAQMLTDAGFEAPLIGDIRADIWLKLAANAAFNPVSLITGKTVGEMLDDPATRKLLEQIMIEVIAVAAALKVAVRMTSMQLLEASRPFSAHKTSMLQDFEAGRSLELEPMVGAVLELAQMAGVAATSLNMVYGLAAAKSRAV